MTHHQVTSHGVVVFHAAGEAIASAAGALHNIHRAPETSETDLREHLTQSARQDKTTGKELARNESRALMSRTETRSGRNER